MRSLVDPLAWMTAILLLALASVAGGDNASDSAENDASDDMRSLRAWMGDSFSTLPCFDHSAPSSDGSGMFLNGGKYHLSRGRDSGEAEFVGGVTWEQFDRTLQGWAATLQQEMMDSNHWVSHIPHFGELDATQVFAEANFFDLAGRRTTRPEGSWGGPPPRNHRGWATGTASEGQFPFVQRLLVPPSSVVAVFGDLHGSIHSLLRELAALVDRGYLLDDWRIAPEWEGRVYLLFLGDYVDRGFYGVEVLYTMMRLKIANPSAVFMTRGNHEDLLLNAADLGGNFIREVRNKFPQVNAEDLLSRVGRMYDLMPWALFLGVRGAPNRDVLLACHGGIEVGYDPEPLLQRKELDVPEEKAAITPDVQYAPVLFLLRERWLESVEGSLRDEIESRFSVYFRDYQVNPSASDNEENDEREGNSATGAQWARRAASAEPFPVPPTGADPAVGFLWSDFFVHDQHSALEVTPGRGLILGKPLTEHWLKRAGVKAVLRAHQHNDNPLAGPMLGELRKRSGLVDNWDHAGLVFTFLSGSECPGFGFHHDSFGLLHIPSHEASNWRLLHCHHDVGSQAVKLGNRWTDGQPWSSRAAFRNGSENETTFSTLDAATTPELESPTDFIEPSVGDTLRWEEDTVNAVWLSPGLATRRERFLLRNYLPETQHACDITHRFVCEEAGWGGHPPRLPRAVARALAQSVREGWVERRTTEAREERGEAEGGGGVTATLQLRVARPVSGSVLSTGPKGDIAVRSQWADKDSRVYTRPTDTSVTDIPVTVEVTDCSIDGVAAQSDAEAPVVCVTLWKVRDLVPLVKSDSLKQPRPHAFTHEHGPLREVKHHCLSLPLTGGLTSSACPLLSESFNFRNVSAGVYAVEFEAIAARGGARDEQVLVVGVE